MIKKLLLRKVSAKSKVVFENGPFFIGPKGQIRGGPKFFLVGRHNLFLEKFCEF